MNFFDTQAGYDFATHTVPALIDAINRLALAIEKASDAKGEEPAGTASNVASMFK